MRIGGLTHEQWTADALDDNGMAVVDPTRLDALLIAAFAAESKLAEQQAALEAAEKALVMLNNYLPLEKSAKERHAARGHKDGLFRDCENWSCGELRDALKVVDAFLRAIPPLTEKGEK